MLSIALIAVLGVAVLARWRMGPDTSETSNQQATNTPERVERQSEAVDRVQSDSLSVRSSIEGTPESGPNNQSPSSIVDRSQDEIDDPAAQPVALSKNNSQVQAIEERIAQALRSEINSASTPESMRIETEILNFLSQNADYGITSITDVRCDARYCKVELTGLGQPAMVELAQELRAYEGIPSGVIILEPVGFDSTELFFEYDAKALDETRTILGSYSEI